MFGLEERPFDTREFPAPVPSAGVFDSPTVPMCINSQWVSHIDGLLERLLYADAWAGTESEVEDAIQQVQVLLSTLATIGDCMPVSTPIGAVSAFAGSAAPDGWFLCHGQAVSRSTYSLLFFVIGTAYGAGDGTTTFNLPDLRGRTVIGVGDGGVAFTNRNLGDDVGEESHLLTLAQLPRHNHEVIAYGGAASVSGTNIVKTTNSLVPSLHQTTDAGLSERHSNMQPSLALNFIVYAGE